MADDQLPLEDVRSSNQGACAPCEKEAGANCAIFYEKLMFNELLGEAKKLTDFKEPKDEQPQTPPSPTPPSPEVKGLLAKMLRPAEEFRLTPTPGYNPRADQLAQQFLAPTGYVPGPLQIFPSGRFWRAEWRVAVSRLLKERQMVSPPIAVPSMAWAGDKNFVIILRPADSKGFAKTRGRGFVDLKCQQVQHSEAGLWISFWAAWWHLVMFALADLAL